MDPMRHQLLESYKVNTVNALIYGPNDMRGMVAVENIRQILKQLPPNDPDIRQIDHQLLAIICMECKLFLRRFSIMGEIRNKGGNF